MPAHPADIEMADLSVFLTVARLGSLGAAGQELRLATPSVSARMSSLERKLGVGLLVRSTRGSELSEAGRRLVPYAERTLVMLQEAAHAVRVESAQRVRVGAPASVGATLFPPLVEVLTDAGLSSHCRVAHSQEIVGQIQDGTVDVGITINQIVPASLSAVSMGKSDLAVVCAADHELADTRDVTVDDLTDVPVVVFRWSPEAEALSAALEANNSRRRTSPLHLIGLPHSALDLVLGDGHVAVVPDYVAQRLLTAGRLARLDIALPGWALEVQMVYRAGHESSPGVSAILGSLDTLRQVISGRAGRDA